MCSPEAGVCIAMDGLASRLRLSLASNADGPGASARANVCQHPMMTLMLGMRGMTIDRMENGSRTCVGPLDVLIVSPTRGQPWYVYILKEQISKDGAFRVLGRSKIRLRESGNLGFLGCI